VQRRLVAVFDHQRHAVAARGGDQCRTMCRGVAHLQRVLQRHTLQLLGKLSHQPIQRFGIGRMAWIELPQQRAEPVTQRQRRLQEGRGRVHGAGQVATLDQVAWRLHRETEALRRLCCPLRALARGGRAVEGAIDLDAAQGATGVGQFLALWQPCRIEHAAAPRGKHPATDATADLRRMRRRDHWPWSSRHGS